MGKNKNQSKLLKAVAQLLLAIAAAIEAIANMINSLNRQQEREVGRCPCLVYPLYTISAK